MAVASLRFQVAIAPCGRPQTAVKLFFFFFFFFFIGDDLLVDCSEEEQLVVNSWSSATTGQSHQDADSGEAATEISSRR